MMTNIMKTEANIQLFDLIAEIKQFLQPFKSVHADNPSTPARQIGAEPMPSVVIERFLLSEFFEILTILKLIDDASKRLWSFIQKEYASSVNRPDIFVDDIELYIKRRMKKIEERDQIMGELSVFIKALYEWLYHITELLEADSTLKDKISSSPQWSTLKDYCLFRHHLVTHKKKVVVDLSGGFVNLVDKNTIELVMLPLNPPQRAINELNDLFSLCAPELEPEDATEENFSNRCRILSQNIHKFNDTQKVKYQDFIKKFGTISDTTVRTAKFVKDFLQTAIPKIKP
jgi:hypothetical protein